MGMGKGAGIIPENRPRELGFILNYIKNTLRNSYFKLTSYFTESLL